MAALPVMKLGTLLLRTLSKPITNHLKSQAAAEKRKCKAQYSIAVKRKEAEQIETKMAPVARDWPWVERLAELKQMEAEKRAAMA
ncbi:hypothetical protein ZWY2020_058155 [Hordeum vulgare]|nr:hypothetical protein ZWY2020_058155 [Hordeum vulgare]